MFNIIFRDILSLKRGLKMQMNPVPTNQILVSSVVIFRSKNIKQGNIFNLIYLYAWLIIQMRHHWQTSKCNAKKMASKAFNIREVSNPYVAMVTKLIVQSTVTRISLQRVRDF